MADGRFEISVVIAALNGQDVIGQQLEALSKQANDLAFEVIVADNGSTDGTEEIAKSFASRLHLRVLDASAVPGQGAARNFGAKAARASKLVFLDQDDVVTSGYLDAMCRALDHHAMVGARIDHLSLNPGWISSSRRPAQVASLGNALGFVPYAGGQTIGIARPIFEEVGGFDPTMPGAVEDVDLCWRVQLAGGDLAYVPEAVIQYRYRPTIRSQVRQAYNYGVAEATLYHRYRLLGMQRRSTFSALRSWLIWLRTLILARTKGDVAKVAWKLAHDTGMLKTCLRRRVYYP